MLSQGIYRVPCSCGKSYIGQIGRSFKAHLEEHIANTFHNCISKSVIVKHSHNSKHLICFDQTRFLALVPFYPSHVIGKALEIEKHPNFFYREDGYILANLRNPLSTTFLNKCFHHLSPYTFSPFFSLSCLLFILTSCILLNSLFLSMMFKLTQHRCKLACIFYGFMEFSSSLELCDPI